MAEQNHPTKRRAFIRMLGTAGCTLLLAPRLLAGAGAQLGTVQASSGSLAPASAGAQGTVQAKKRVCPCCDAA